MQESQQWVKDNQSLIARVAEGSYQDVLSDWDEVDEPWHIHGSM